jgi:hypothetical protein
MVVRLLANKESRRPKGEIIKNRKHYMDMRFWVSLFPVINVLIYSIYIESSCGHVYILIQRMIGFDKLPKYHQDPTAEELGPVWFSFFLINFSENLAVGRI